MIRTKETKRRRRLTQCHVVLVGVAMVLDQEVGFHRNLVPVMLMVRTTTMTIALGTTTMAMKISRAQASQNAM